MAMIFFFSLSPYPNRYGTERKTSSREPTSLDESRDAWLIANPAQHTHGVFAHSLADREAGVT